MCNLAEKGRLDEGLSVLGFARRPLDDASYRDFTWASCQSERRTDTDATSHAA
ncbi:MAG TPA: hypothetical protein DC056_06260 [Dehalococcoidia bacterium]|nr:hypothetical protein [Dehalococcoidia bacterium]